MRPILLGWVLRCSGGVRRANPAPSPPPQHSPPPPPALPKHARWPAVYQNHNADAERQLHQCQSTVGALPEQLVRIRDGSPPKSGVKPPSASPRRRRRPTSPCLPARSPTLANDGAPVQLGPGAPQRLRKRRIDGLHRGGRSCSAASKQRPRRARLAGPATSSNGVSPQTQLREPPVLSVHCCAGYATIYTVASGHKEATINARRAEMLYMAACRVLRDRAAAPSQSVWASSAGQIASPGQIDRARPQ